MNPTTAAGFASGALGVALGSRLVGGRMVSAWLSDGLRNDAWDGFLSREPSGQFQQSSLWASAKSAEGWNPLRVMVACGEELVGGMQLLTRPTRAGLVGYGYKGPVLNSRDPELVGFALDQIVSAARRKRLRAFVMQSPAGPALDTSLLASRGFLPNRTVSFDRATLVVDLAGGMDRVRAGMRRTTAREVRQAERRGVVVREGGEADIPLFFRMMLATCARQNTGPTPATEAAVRAVWKEFHARGAARLTFAEFGGAPIAGLLCLAFGERFTAWKKGSFAEHREKRPDQFLMFEAIGHAHSRGFKLFDFAALNHQTALALTEGRPLSEDQMQILDFFNLGFGGSPVLFPDSLIFVCNPLARFAYRTVASHRWFQNLRGRLLR